MSHSENIKSNIMRCQLIFVRQKYSEYTCMFVWNNLIWTTFIWKFQKIRYLHNKLLEVALVIVIHRVGWQTLLYKNWPMWVVQYMLSYSLFNLGLCLGLCIAFLAEIFNEGMGQGKLPLWVRKMLGLLLSWNICAVLVHNVHVEPEKFWRTIFYRWDRIPKKCKRFYSHKFQATIIQ